MTERYEFDFEVAANAVYQLDEIINELADDLNASEQTIIIPPTYEEMNPYHLFLLQLNEAVNAINALQETICDIEAQQEDKTND